MGIAIVKEIIHIDKSGSFPSSFLILHANRLLAEFCSMFQIRALYSPRVLCVCNLQLAQFSNPTKRDLKSQAVEMAATNRNEGVFMFHIHLETAQSIGIKASLEVGDLFPNLHEK